MNGAKICVSLHGRERILQRLGCRKDKVEKIAEKAFRSKQWPNCMKELKSPDENVFYRFIFGLVFVFKHEPERKKIILVTAYRK